MIKLKKRKITGDKIKKKIKLFKNSSESKTIFLPLGKTTCHYAKICNFSNENKINIKMHNNFQQEIKTKEKLSINTTASCRTMSWKKNDDYFYFKVLLYYVETSNMVLDNDDLSSFKNNLFSDDKNYGYFIFLKINVLSVMTPCLRH